MEARLEKIRLTNLAEVARIAEVFESLSSEPCSTFYNDGMYFTLRPTQVERILGGEVRFTVMTQLQQADFAYRIEEGGVSIIKCRADPHEVIRALEMKNIRAWYDNDRRTRHLRPQTYDDYKPASKLVSFRW